MWEKQDWWGRAGAWIWIGLQCPTEECPKMRGPQVANEKTTELLAVELQNNLYLSVVRRTFEIVIFCQ